MGVVYLAHDLTLERRVAVKVLGERLLSEPNARERFLREAKTASALNHPHVCTVHEVGEDNGQAYIVMEYVEGRPLSEALASGLLPDAVVRYGIQIADALAHAHDRGIVHRDLKTHNVIVTPEGRAKVLDFGLAKRLPTEELAEQPTRSADSLTEAGQIVGTLHYLSPEVLRGRAADMRTDVWALGVLLYELATGDRPFQGKTKFEVTSAILEQPPRPLPESVPAGLRSVIERCLAKEPGERYQRGSEVRAALEAVQSGSFTAEQPPAPRGGVAALAAPGAWRAAAVAGAGAGGRSVLRGSRAEHRLDRGAALRQRGRRSGNGVPERRGHGERDLQPLAHPQAQGDRLHLGAALQGQDGRSTRGRPRAAGSRGPHRPHPAARRRAIDHHGAGRHPRPEPVVGRAVRPEGDEPPGRAGRYRAEDLRASAAAPDRRGAGAAQEAVHGRRRGVPALPQGPVPPGAGSRRRATRRPSSTSGRPSTRIPTTPSPTPASPIPSSA